MIVSHTLVEREERRVACFTPRICPRGTVTAITFALITASGEKSAPALLPLIHSAIKNRDG